MSKRSTPSEFGAQRESHYGRMEKIFAWHESRRFSCHKVFMASKSFLSLPDFG